MTLLAGIDLSSARLDAALIPLDPDNTTVPPVAFRRYDLPRMPAGATAQYRTVERTRAIRTAVRHLLRQLSVSDPHFRTIGLVASVWVEEPLGGGPRANTATNVLRELYGAILASVPAHIERTAIAPQEWRVALGCRARAPKEDVHQVAAGLLAIPTGADEHQLDALCVALAGRRLTWQAHERRTA